MPPTKFPYRSEYDWFTNMLVEDPVTACLLVFAAGLLIGSWFGANL